MKKLLSLSLCLLWGLGAFAQCPLTEAIDFTTEDHHGNEINLFEILDRGQYVLIDFFYSSCGPCQVAVPKVVEAYQALGCNQHDVFFMEISPTDSNNAPLYPIDNWINTYGIEFPTIYPTSGGEHNGEDICSMYQIPAYPTMVLISPDREILLQDIWPLDSAQTIIDALAPFGIEEHECGESGESGDLPITEHFDSSSIPDGWNIIGSGQDNWSVSPTNNAGGAAYEMGLYWNPSFIGTSRLCTPAVDLTGVSSVLFSFKHYFDNYQSAGSTIGIATSSDNGNTWNEGWSMEYNTDGQYNIDQIITTSDMGKSDVMFCIYFDGNSSNIDNWYFDDISISTVKNDNANLLSIDIADYILPGEVEVAFTMQNNGLNDITSFNASYEINGITFNETFYPDLSMLENNQFIFSEKVNLIPGNYELTINIEAVNGLYNNNTLSKEFGVAMGTTQRIPMIEHFTSSTCGPCVYNNNQMDNVCSSNPGKFAYVKYPMYWPSPGDPYNTDESNVRKEYYNIIAVPHIVYDGVNIGAEAVTAHQLNESFNSNAFVNIKGAFDIQGNTINVIADVMPYVTLEDCKVFVAVNEKTTTGNVGTNGETEFHHIMMKMLGNAEGNDISVEAGEYQRYEFSYNMSQTYVEEMNDLEVAVWVQHYNSQEIFNSTFLNEYTEHNYPAQNLRIDGYVVSWDAPEQGNPTGYNLYINNELVVENLQNLSYSVNITETIIAEVVALYGDKTSVGLAKMFELDSAPITNFWTPDPTLYANNMTVIANVNIDGIDQANPNLELGAFCGDEVRGSIKPQFVPAPINRYEYFLMVYGNANDNITFKLYDHESQSVVDLDCQNNISFEVNGTVGNMLDPYNISFTSDITQSTALTSGWNWYSSYIDVEGAEGLNLMKEALGTSAAQIKNQTAFIDYASIWFGTLTATNLEEMYMIKMNSALNMETTGPEANPTDHPITLGTNWKWIGYPVNGTMSVNEAFSNITPNSGDYVKSQVGFAQYYEGLGWTGTLNTMAPGQGYMYQNTSGTVKTLVYPEANAKSELDANITSENNHWVPNSTKYPTNMTMIATVEGMKDYEVAAFCNGEVRGSARPIYVEQLDSYMIFLTIYGEENDEITFRYFDLNTEEEIELLDVMNYGVNATIGDVMNPHVLNFATLNVDEMSSSLSIYPNPVEKGGKVYFGATCEKVEIYNTLGAKVAEYTDVNSIEGIEASGVYVVKAINNGNVSYSRIIVR